ncbi:MAG: NAD(P)-dependent alcohol dehydrogenase [Candidatus Aminicenantes bacterium]|nr:NAD(P)-dependent alcohol dehydrogenase [Candidatus Aminicenantes bacterium]
MKAIICTKFGPPEVLQLIELENPTPNDDEVLIRNYGTSINTVDIVARSGKAPSVIFWGARQLTGFFLRLSLGGLKKPKQKIPGGGFAGEIVSVGKDVLDWKSGDRVYGYHKGACSEYMTVPENLLSKIPANLNFQEASAIPGGFSPAILALRDLVQIQKGDKVLIIGASGGIGTFGVQIAKIYGAEVTGVCGSGNGELVREIGADYVIDYTKEDYSKNDNSYDFIFDAVAASTLSKCRNILKDEGVYISNNPVNSPKTIFHLMTNFSRKKKIKTGMADESAKNLNSLYEWIESGKLKPVIDKVYPLSQTAEAQRHYETGHSKGRVVISID